jgi:hypothetical protein
VPVSALRLDVAEPYFSRHIWLDYISDPPTDAGGSTLQTLFNGTLTRKDSSEGSVTLNFGGRRVDEAILNIDNGDNAPLTIRGAEFVVPLRRVVFKLKPEPGASYRLLLGNPRAEAPSYDIEALRREVLAYSAIPAVAGALAPNPDYHRRALDWAGGVSSTAWVWGALIVAVAVLLLLTVRLLKKP